MLISMYTYHVRSYALCIFTVILMGFCENFEKCLTSIIITKDYRGQYEVFGLQRTVSSANVVLQIIIRTLFLQFGMYYELVFVLIFFIVVAWFVL